ncbi:MAG: hypothetical protein ABH885_02955 [Candidatus Omnitrophota bacterium]
MTKKHRYKIKGLKGKVHVNEQFFIKGKVSEVNKKRALEQKEIMKNAVPDKADLARKRIVFRRAVLKNNDVLFQIPPETLGPRKGYL